MNIARGIILRNISTSEYRYFIPYRNFNLFESNIRVSNKDDLMSLERRIHQLDIHAYILQQRENTEWKPHFISNIIFFVYRLNFPLGKGDIPDYIKKKHHIISLDRDRRGLKYDDALGAFRCLATHTNQTYIETSVNHYYQIWKDYCSNMLDTELPSNKTKYEGVTTDQMPPFERCFAIQVTICSLEKDGSIKTILSRQQTTKRICT